MKFAGLIVSSLLIVGGFSVGIFSQSASADDAPSQGQAEGNSGGSGEAVPEAGSQPSYCFERVGVVNAEPTRGEVCSVYANGAGARVESLARPDRNTATLILSSPSLEAVGVKAFAFNLSRGDGVPEFGTGTHVMDQVRMYGVEVDDLPDRMAFVSDLSGKNSMFSVTAPDAAYLRQNASGVDFTGYEIASATLTIDTVVAIPLEPFEKDMAEKIGMKIGHQYIAGTVSFSLIPLGSTGEQYGPKTFEFGTPFDWGLLPQLN